MVRLFTQRSPSEMTDNKSVVVNPNLAQKKGLNDIKSTRRLHGSLLLGSGNPDKI